MPVRIVPIMRTTAAVLTQVRTQVSYTRRSITIVTRAKTAAWPTTTPSIPRVRHPRRHTSRTLTLAECPVAAITCCCSRRPLRRPRPRTRRHCLRPRPRRLPPRPRATEKHRVKRQTSVTSVRIRIIQLIAAGSWGRMQPRALSWTRSMRLICQVFLPRPPQHSRSSPEFSCCYISRRRVRVQARAHISLLLRI